MSAGESLSVRRLMAAALVGMLATPLVAAADPACVGSPSRQTSDPMSPTCIDSFGGENGGATAPGVSESRVDVVLYNDLGISGDLSGPWSETDEVILHQGDPSGVTTNLVRTAKALVSHFQSRYQTFGRTVRVIAYPSSQGETPICAARRSDVTHAINAYQPFAVATVGNMHGCVFDATSSGNVLGLGMAVFASDAHVAEGRHAYTFAPTLERITKASAGYICRSLAGRPARYAEGNLQGQTRRFGLIYQSTDQWIADQAVALTVEVGQRCGISFKPVRSYRRGAPQDLATAVVNAAAPGGATTLICLCPAPERDAHLAVATARALTYQPEWIWLPAARIDRATVLRGLGDPLGAHMGISSTWMAPGADDQQAVRAARDADPNLDPNPLATTDLFVALRLLFTGIQTAGPDLTRANVEVGLRAHQPMTTIGEVVPGGFAAGAPASWTSSFVAWSFDPMARPPGAATAQGCMRLVGNGARYLDSTWPTTDLALRTGACTGDLYRQPVDAPISFLTTAANTG